jgi:anti-sigma B factor antagonist
MILGTDLLNYDIIIDKQFESKTKTRGGKSMNIKKNAEGEKLTISIEGRLDTTTAPDAEKEIKESTENVKDLVLDFEKLEYISSAGLRVVLGAQKMMNKKGKMTIRNANEMVMEVFELTGLADVFTIE